MNWEARASNPKILGYALHVERVHYIDMAGKQHKVSFEDMDAAFTDPLGKCRPERGGVGKSWYYTSERYLEPLQVHKQASTACPNCGYNLQALKHSPCQDECHPKGLALIDMV